MRDSEVDVEDEKGKRTRMRIRFVWPFDNAEDYDADGRTVFATVFWLVDLTRFMVH